MQVRLDDEDVDRIAQAVAVLVAERLPESKPSPWMVSAEAAEYLRLSLDALHRLAAAGAVPHAKQAGRCLFTRAELHAWLADHNAAPTRAVSMPFPGRRKAA